MTEPASATTRGDDRGRVHAGEERVLGGEEQRWPGSPPACEATAMPPASDSRAASAAGAGIPATASSMPPR